MIMAKAVTTIVVVPFACAERRRVPIVKPGPLTQTRVKSQDHLLAGTVGAFCRFSGRFSVPSGPVWQYRGRRFALDLPS
jgi:hypothetical protein